MIIQYDKCTSVTQILPRKQAEIGQIVRRYIRMTSPGPGLRIFPTNAAEYSKSTEETWYLKHWPCIVGMSGSMPKVISLQSLVHQITSLSQQALSLHIHTMLLVPCGARPAHHNWSCKHCWMQIVCDQKAAIGELHSYVGLCRLPSCLVF